MPKPLPVEDLGRSRPGSEHDEHAADLDVGGKHGAEPGSMLSELRARHAASEAAASPTHHLETLTAIGGEILVSALRQLVSASAASASMIEAAGEKGIDGRPLQIGFIQGHGPRS